MQFPLQDGWFDYKSGAAWICLWSRSKASQLWGSLASSSPFAQLDQALNTAFVVAVMRAHISPLCPLAWGSLKIEYFIRRQIRPFATLTYCMRIKESRLDDARFGFCNVWSTSQLILSWYHPLIHMYMDLLVICIVNMQKQGRIHGIRCSQTPL